MSLDHAILGFLSAEPMTGYDLKTRRFDATSAAFWTADQAQIYRTLERLERSDLVVSKLVPQPGRPDRKVFNVTAAGRRALREWLETPHPLPPLRDPFLLQLFFAAPLTDEAVRAVLETARDGYQRRLERLRGDAAQQAAEEASGPRERELRRMAVRGAMAQARATVDWIDDCLDRISSGLPVNGDAPTTGSV